MLFFVMHMFFCLSPLLNTYHVGRVIEGYEKQNNIGVFLNTDSLVFEQMEF